MAFSVNTVTTAGQALIAQASSGNRVIFTRVGSAYDALSYEDARAADYTDFDGVWGRIAAASATGAVARIVGSISNAEGRGGTLKSFGLFARLENGSEVCVAVVSDENAAVELPASGPLVAVSIAFSIAIEAGAAGVVEITSAGSASLSDLSRFFSLHAPGDTEAGEAQTALGAKKILFADEGEGGLTEVVQTEYIDREEYGTHFMHHSEVNGVARSSVKATFRKGETYAQIDIEAATNVNISATNFKAEAENALIPGLAQHSGGTPSVGAFALIQMPVSADLSRSPGDIVSAADAQIYWAVLGVGGTVGLTQITEGSYQLCNPIPASSTVSMGVALAMRVS